MVSIVDLNTDSAKKNFFCGHCKTGVTHYPQRTPLAPIWPLRAPTPPSITCRRGFSLFYYQYARYVLEQPYFFQFFAFVGLFLFFTRYLFCARTMSEHVVEHLRTAVVLNIAVSYRNHSTAQRHQPAQSRKASTCRSECDKASKQTELGRAGTYMSSSIDTAR